MVMLNFEEVNFDGLTLGSTEVGERALEYLYIGLKVVFVLWSVTFSSLALQVLLDFFEQSSLIIRVIQMHGCDLCMNEGMCGELCLLEMMITLGCLKDIRQFGFLLGRISFTWFFLRGYNLCLIKSMMIWLYF